MKHIFSGKVGTDGLSDRPVHTNIDRPGLAVVKESAGRFTLILPPSPSNSMLLVETNPPTRFDSDISKSATRTRSSSEGDTWKIRIDKLEVKRSWSELPKVVAVTPYDSGFFFMLVWED